MLFSQTRCTVLAASLLFLSPPLGTVSATRSKTQTETKEQIEVKLAAEKNSVPAGGSLEIQVQIRNVSHETLFIGKNILSFDPVSKLVIHLEGGKPTSGPGVGSAVDYVADPNISFANSLVKHWIALPPGHFYGTVMMAGPKMLPQLSTPGHYLLSGHYISGGFNTLLSFDGVKLNPDDAGKLPYKAWRGKVETNSVPIEVLAPNK